MFTSDMLTWLPETSNWVPAECDVPIRTHHWFWHPNDEDSLRPLDNLMDIYYRSVGHGTVLLLNISPDDRGLFPDIDVERVIEFGDEIRHRFDHPIAQSSGEGAEQILTLPEESLIDHAILMEQISEGERIQEYVLESMKDGVWVELVQGTAIGHKKIDRFKAIRTKQLRLTLTKCIELPLIRFFAVYCTELDSK